MKKTILIISFFITIYKINAQCELDYSKFETTPHFIEEFNDTLGGFWDTWDWKNHWGSYNNGKNIKINPAGEFSIKILGKTFHPFGGRKNIINVNTKENISVSGGSLHLKVKKLATEKHLTFTKNGTTETFDYKYEGALLRTNIGDLAGCEHSFTDANGVFHPASYWQGWKYGLFEIECEIPDNYDYYSSFWMLGSRSARAEIDIFEFDSDKKPGVVFYNTAHYYDPANPNTKHLTDKVHFEDNGNLMNTTHKWSVLWTPTKITYYLDGIELNTVNRIIKDDSNPNHCNYNNMDIILSVGAPLGAYWDGPFLNRYDEYEEDLEFKVNWVKLWKPIVDYDDVNEPPFEIKKIKDNVTDVNNNLIAFSNNIYYRTSNNKLKGFTFNNNAWTKINVFNTISHTIKSDPVIESKNKIYFKGNGNKLYNLYKSSGIWSSASIHSTQQIKDKIHLSNIGPSSEIVYTDMDRTLKHFFWETSSWHNTFYHHYTITEGKKANDNFLVTPKFIIYESRKPFLLVFWNRDKHLWVSYKAWTTGGHLVQRHKFPTEIYTQGTNQKTRNFISSANGHDIYYITKNHRLKKHHYNNSTDTWQEDIEIKNSVTDVYDNLILADNGNKIFYTDYSNHLCNFYKVGNTWHNAKIGWKKISDPIYDATTERVYFNRKDNGNIHFNKLQYYEWQTNSNQWVLMSPLNGSNSKIKGKIAKTQNDQIVYNGILNRPWVAERGIECTEKVYGNESTVFDIHSNKTTALNSEPYVYEDNTLEYSFDDEGSLIDSFITPVFNNFNEYLKYSRKHLNNLKMIDSHEVKSDKIYVINRVSPSPTSGIFTVNFNDKVCVSGDYLQRTIKIIKPLTNKIIKEKTFLISDKSITFDISTETDGIYFLKLLREDNSIENKIIIKVE